MVHQMLAYASGLTEGGRIRWEIADDRRKSDIVEDGGLVRVVNPDPLESETARCTPEEFAGRFGFRLPAPASEDANHNDICEPPATAGCAATNSGPGWR